MRKKYNIDEEKRREWRQALRNFRTTIKAMHKLGVTKIVCKQIENKPIIMPDWYKEEWVNLLCESIKSQTISNILIEGFIQTVRYKYKIYSNLFGVTERDVDRAINDVLKKLNVPLRKKWGVIKEN